MMPAHRKRTIHSCAKQAGFTLMELLIAVLIISILTGIAMPLYQDYIAQARRADATTMLGEIAALQEQHFLDNKSYAANLTGLGYSSATVNTNNTFYAISVAAATTSCPIATCYTLEAAPQNGQAGDACGKLTLNAQGDKLPTTSGCWTR